MKKNVFFWGTAVFVAAIFFTACPNPSGSDTKKPGNEDYKVTVQGSDNGSITANPLKGPSGTVVSIQANPAQGYRLARLTANNTVIDTTSTGPWTYTLTGNVTLTASFEKIPADQYSVTIAPSENGTITATPRQGPSGTQVSIQANPVEGYRLEELRANDVVIEATGDGPWTYTLTGHVTLTASFGALPSGQYSVTIATTIQNGSISATPKYGPAGTIVNLTITPDSGYVLKAGSLKYTTSGGTVSITETFFTLPAAHVTVSAEFEGQNVDQLINAGTNALANGNFDEAIAQFESAYQQNRTNTEAVVYSSLAKLASIARDQNVRNLMSGKLGFTNYPGTIDSLISGDWLESYPEEDYWASWTERLPGLDLPNWFAPPQDNSINGSLRASAWPLLLFANLVDKNPNGLNNLLDDVLSYAFGAAFEDAAGRFENLSYNQAVDIDEDVIEALGLSEVLEGNNISVGKAELAVLFSAVRLFKASLEWVAAYDWNTDISFLKADWEDLDLDISSVSPENLPFRNNFMKNRNNGLMDKSKDNFVKAIESAVEAYEYLTGSRSNLPYAYIEKMEEYRGLKDGLSKLGTAIDTDDYFWVKEPSENSYSNTPYTASFGINTEKLFTPGQFAIDQLIETEANGRAPKFYALNESGDTGTVITDVSGFASAPYGVGFKIKLARIKEVIRESSKTFYPNNDIFVSLFPAEFGKELYSLYHQ